MAYRTTLILRPYSSLGGGSWDLREWRKKEQGSEGRLSSCTQPPGIRSTMKQTPDETDSPSDDNEYSLDRPEKEPQVCVSFPLRSQFFGAIALTTNCLALCPREHAACEAVLPTRPVYFLHLAIHKAEGKPAGFCILSSCSPQRFN